MAVKDYWQRLCHMIQTAETGRGPRGGGPPMGSRAATALLPATPDAVWRRLADFGAIATWAPPVAHSRMLTTGDLGVGSVRRVQVGRQALLETVTTCEPPRRLAYRLSGLPARIGSVTTTWELAAEAPDATRVTVASHLASSLPRPVAALVGRRLARANADLLAGLQAAVTAETEANA